jgi:murein L,D-transpeptidase YafK
VNPAPAPLNFGMPIICTMRTNCCSALCTIAMLLSVVAATHADETTIGSLAASIEGAPSAGVADLAPSLADDHGLSAQLPIADEVIVRKSQRRLYLLRRGEVIRSYKVALGLIPEGPKERAGDFRTPEGHYQLTRRNSRSDFFLSIQVSYPNADDVRRAHSHHIDPGGSIMIHGLPNNLRHPPDYYMSADWTDGCIALSNSDMVEVWMMTQDNVRLEILP